MNLQHHRYWYKEQNSNKEEEGAPFAHKER